MRNLVPKKQVVIGTVNAGHDAFAAIRDLGTFVRRWPAAVHGLVTGRFPLDAAAGLLREQRAGIEDVVALR